MKLGRSQSCSVSAARASILAASCTNVDGEIVVGGWAVGIAIVSKDIWDAGVVRATLIVVDRGWRKARFEVDDFAVIGWTAHLMILIHLITR